MPAFRKRIVILGAGFGGLHAALHLLGELDGEAEITLVDRNNYSTFLPFLPQVISGRLGIKSVAHLARRPNIRFLLGRVEGIDLPGKRVLLDATSLEYDYLVMALGSVANLRGTEGLGRTFTLQSLGDAFRIKYHILDLLEGATVNGAERRRAALTFVVCGGGPRGVEVAAEVQRFVREVVCRQYPELDPDLVHTVLVHGTERLLPDLPRDTSRLALEALRNLGVEVLPGSTVTNWDGRKVTIDSGREIPTETLLWLTGFRANPVLDGLPLERDPNGRITVEHTLEVPGFDGVYAVGDNASLLDEGTGRPYQLVSSVAVRQGVHAAANIVRSCRGLPQIPFRYSHRGGALTLGTGRAIVDRRGVRLDGVPGWWVYGAESLLRLPGLKNKLELVHDWFFCLLFGPDTFLVRL